MEYRNIKTTSDSRARHSRVWRGNEAGTKRSATVLPKIKQEKTILRLIVCGAVLAVAIVFKLFFAGSAENLRSGISNAVSGDVDYKAAIASIGEGIGGEKKLSDALSDAYSYAFEIKKDNDVTVMTK